VPEREEVQKMSWQLIFLSSFLLILSYPPFDFGWLAWVAFVPWLAALEQATPRQAFVRSFWVGLFFFASTIWWLVHVTAVGLILLVPYLALFFGAWGWLVARVQNQKSPVLSCLAAAGAWSLLEYLRSILLSGLGWNLLAHTQWHWLPIIQIADVTGVYGVSFLVVLVNAALHRLIRQAKSRKDFHDLPLLLLTGLCLLATWGYGTFYFFDQARSHRVAGKAVTVAVVQGNIPQPEKWDEAFQEAIWKRYEALTAEAVKKSPDLILWPETAVPGYLDDPAIEGRLRQFARAGGIPMFIGVPVGEVGTDRVFNSAVLLDAGGTILDRYDKIHLVPFGEFVPMEPVFGWLRKLVLMGTFSHGRRFTVFHSSSLPDFSVLICFEDIFPGLTRGFAQAGARWLVVITNDAWFGRSAASIQHLQASVFRAVEERMCVVRAANTGWSGVIAPSGQVLPAPHQIPRFKPGVATGPVLPASGLTLYARWGDWFQILCLLLVGWGYNKSLSLKETDGSAGSACQTKSYETRSDPKNRRRSLPDPV